MKDISVEDLKKVQVLQIGNIRLSSLKADEYFLSVESHIKNQFNKRCSEKVHSHIILTKSVFVMNHFAVYVDFENMKIFFESYDSNEYKISYKNDNELMRCLHLILDNSPYNEDDSYDYEDFREESRKIFDHLDKYENLTTYNIWNDYIDLSIRWFA